MIEIKNLNKYYGQFRAVSNLDIKIEQGDIFGFIGPNGAGKTTTIRMLSTLMKPTSGEIYVNGISVAEKPMEIRKIIGYVPDEYGLYDEMSVGEYLEYSASLMKVEKKIRESRIKELLNLLDLESKRDTQLYGLSRGMRNRVFLARALIHDPLVLILDEPASGLDPRARIEFRDIMKQLSQIGKTIFISSHILSEMDDFCNKIGIIEKGKLILSDSVANLSKKTDDENLSILEIKINGDEDILVGFLNGKSYIKSISKMGDSFKLDFTGNNDDKIEILKEIVQLDIGLSDFTENKRKIEDIFLKTTTGGIS